MNEMYEQFRGEVLGEKDLDVSVRGIMLQSNLRGIGALAAIGFGLTLLYIATDYSRKAWNTPYVKWNLAVVLGLVALSIVLMILSYGKKITSKKRWAEMPILIYYLYINGIVFVFTYTRNLRASQSQIPLEYVGLSLTSIYLMVYMVVPMCSKTYSIILMVVVMGSVFVLKFMPGNQAYDLYRQVILHLVVVVGYFVFRRKECRKAERDLHIMELNRQLIMDSYVDSLTGVMNRNALNTYVDYIQKGSATQQISAILINIDLFKQYNDYYSHREGDRLLQYIASAIENVLEQEDPYLFRFGGGSFLILTKGQTDESLVDMAQKYRKAVNVQHLSRADGTGSNHVTISIGCAHIAFQENHELEDCITRADEQLYYCKKKGEQDCVVFQNQIYH